MAPSSKAPYFFAAALALAVIGVYLPGLQNELLFDDMQLKDGTLQQAYGSLLVFKQRMLSYGSFVWVEQLLGAGWWKQRLVNLALHLGVIASAYALLSQLLAHTRFPQDMEEQDHFQASRQAALWVGLTVFALNPVAVYAVNYLIQRSILMATLLATLACWSFVRGLQTQRAAWHVGSAVLYVAAVLSKEHAIMTAALAIPLYIYVCRPSWRKVATVSAIALMVLAAATAALLHFYGDLIGKTFDPQSVAFAQQLEALRPGITAQLYPLSILNEAALFFVYGTLWLLPYPGWMSVDLRPAFPLGLASSWHIVGALGYAALLIAAGWALLRRTGALSLAALLLLLPLLWYATEFSTVWIQDPFVLYRSYLWAIAIPGLLAIVLTGFRPKTLYAVGTMAALALGALAVERTLSMRDEASAWADAADKIDPQAPANAVGRSRPYMNLGAYHLRQGLIDQAEREFKMAQSFGDRGMLGANTRFNLGVVLQQRGKHPQALEALQQAQSMGYSGAPLHYHLGESQAALGQADAAFQNIDKALTEARNTPAFKNLIPTLTLRRAEVAIAAQRFDDAAQDFRTLLQASPNNAKYTQGLGIALMRKGEVTQAIALFDDLIKAAPTASAYYGRAMVLHHSGRTALAIKDLDKAIELEPRNPQYPKTRAQLMAPAAK